MDISSYDEQFQILIERLDSNTREGTENDFYKDMNGIDWIIGRGMSGTYYSPSVSDIDTKNRPLIETGFLNIILHGGVLALLPLIIILIHASYLGLFKSQSLIYKSCGIFIFIRLLWLYPSSSFKLNLTFSILWICVAICESIESKNKINLVNKTFITN